MLLMEKDPDQRFLYLKTILTSWIYEREERNNLLGMLNSELIKHLRKMHQKLEKTDFEFFQKHNIGSAYIKQVKQICEEYSSEWAKIIFDTICENIYNSNLVTPDTEGELIVIYHKYYGLFDKHIN